MTTQLEGPGSSTWGRRRHWLGVALAAFILLMLAFWLDLGELAAVLSRMPVMALIAIVAMLVLDRVVMAWKWLLLLRVGGIDLPLGRVTSWYFQGSLAGAFIPTMAAGDLLRGYWAAQPTGQPAFVFASLIMERMLGLLSAMHWAIAGTIVLLGWRLPDHLWLWIVLGAAAIVASAAAFILSLHARVHAAVLAALARMKGRRLVGLLHRLYEAYSYFSMARGTLLRNYLLTLGEQMLQMMVYLVIASALASVGKPLLFLAITTLHTLILRVPISPEGWGIGELSAIGLYGLIGIDAEAAFAIMLVFHVALVIACSPGLVLLLRRERPAPSAAVSRGGVAVVERSPSGGGPGSSGAA